MPYYPAQTLVMAAATVRRERKLPPNVISNWTIREGSMVSAEDVILRGVLPADYIVLNALRPLGLKKPEDITDDMLQVTPGQQLFEGDPILSVGKGRRPKTLKAPTNCIFARVEGGDVILQSNPEPVEVTAGYPGRATSLRNNNTSALIESTGALLQAAWGNGHLVYSQLRLEPREGGIESLLGETLVSEYRNVAVVMTRPITSDAPFKVLSQQTITAIIAPSMHSSLRERALEQAVPVLLVEGFGEIDYSEVASELLRNSEGKPATINAIQPDRWSPERPEVLVTLGASYNAPVPVTDQPLAVGSVVRITRAPLRGKTGRVKRLIDAPRPVENGLRLIGAEVELANGQVQFVPLANLEMLGRPVER
jgi:hypothetical protein